MEKVIYVGPNLKNRALLTAQVFIGGLPKHINKELELVPELARLFVPISKMEYAQKQIETTGTPLAKYYAKVREEL